MTARNAPKKPAPILEWQKSTDKSGGYKIMQGGQIMLTPQKREFVVATEALADAIILEFKENKGKLLPHSMPMTQLCLTAIDLVDEAGRLRVIAGLLDKIAFDAILYQAERPARLVIAQEKLWQPVIQALAAQLVCDIAVTHKMEQLAQPPELTAKIAAKLAGFSDYELVVVANLAAQSGSLLLGLAAVMGMIDVPHLVAASQVEDEIQLQIWGEDEEARARLCESEIEIENIMRFFVLARLRV